MATLGDAPLNGVYTLGNYAGNYPIVLDLTYPISVRTAGELTLHDIEIGSVLVVGDEIFVSWKDHTSDTSGIDKVDYSTKLDGAFIQTALLQIVRMHLATYTDFMVAYVDLPEGTDITIEYSQDYGVTFLPTTEVTDAARQLVASEEGVESSTLFVRVTFTCVDNDSPTVDEAMVFVV